MENISAAVKVFDDKYLISWGDGQGITFYGFFIAAGILLGAVFGWLLARKRGYPVDVVIDMVLWCVPVAIVGARLYYIIFTAIGGETWTFGAMFRVWDGGLAVYGGILFAILGCFCLNIFYKKRKKADPAAVNAEIEGLEIKIKGIQAEIDGLSPDADITAGTQRRLESLKSKKKKLERDKRSLDDSLKPKPAFFQMADLGAPFLILGQALGRIGCYFSSCCYGNPVTNPALQWFPLAVQIPSGSDNWHLATFFLESAWCFIGLAIMLYFSLRKKKQPPDGSVFAFYLMFYGLGRFILEFLRFDSSETLWLIPDKLPASMAVAAVMFIWGAYLMIRIFLFKKDGKKGPLKESA